MLLGRSVQLTEPNLLTHERSSASMPFTVSRPEMHSTRRPLPPNGLSGQKKSARLIPVVFLVSILGCNVASERAAGPASQFIYPQPFGHEVVINPFVPLSWQPFNGATGYVLAVGTAAGLQDVFGVGEFPPNVTSWPVDDLLPGSYFARLYTYSASGVGYRDVHFITLPQPLPPAQTAFYATIEQQTASVRLSEGLTGTVVPGTPLAAELALRHRSAPNCTDFAFTLSQLLQQKQIYSRIAMITLDGTSTESHTTVEYYDPFWKKWSVADPTFGVVYFDKSAQRGQGAAELNQYVVSESWSLIKPKFVTSNGDLYMTRYYMDPITLYLNIIPQGDTVQQSVIHDPKQFLVPFSVGLTNPHGVYLFGFDTDTETLQLDNPVGPYSSDSGDIVIDSDASTVWSTAYVLNDNWWIVSAPADAQAYTFRRVLF